MIEEIFATRSDSIMKKRFAGKIQNTLYRQKSGRFLTAGKSLLLCAAFFLVSETRAPGADIEIIDGTDTETLKALFPSLKDQDFSGLEKMRARRLSYEARCVKNESERFVTLLFSERFVSAETARDAVESRKALVERTLASLDLTITKWYDAYENIMDRGAALRGADDFLASYSLSFHTPARDDLLQELKAAFSGSLIRVNIRPFKECPDGNIIFSE